MRTKHVKWSPQIIAALGVLTDEQVVQKFELKVMAHAVGHRRSKLGIPSVITIRNKVDWTPERVAMLGNVPDEEIATLIGIHPGTVAAKRRMVGKAKFKQGARMSVDVRKK